MARDSGFDTGPEGAGVAAPAVTIPAGLRSTVVAQCRLVLCTWPRRSLVAVTILAGALSAVAVIAGAAPDARTFAAVSHPTQALMSVTVPFLGVLLMQEHRRPSSGSAVLPSVLATQVVAVLVAAYGIALCGLVTAVAESQAPHGRWEHAGTVVAGSLLVQILAQLTGTGLGLLVRRPAVACLLTVVLPIGLWLLLGTLDVLRPAQAWLTPYASAQNLLAGDVSPVEWLHWLVVFLTWGIGLNVIGTQRASQAHVALPGPVSR